MGLLIQRAPVIVGALGEVFGVRLVAKAPQHHAGVVFVAVDHGAQHGAVVGFEWEGLVRVAGRPRANTYGRRFINDHDAQPVAEVVDFLGIGVVTHAQAVGVQPLVQLQVGHGHTGIIAAAAESRILVLAGPFEIERFTVDEELVAAHLDTAKAELLAVFILTELD